jgi:hypothetical protein
VNDIKNRYNILVACDPVYHDEWAANLITSLQAHNNWLSITVVVSGGAVDPVPGARYHYVKAPRLHDDNRAAYYQALRFLVASELFDDDQLVMSLDIDTVCTRSFTPEEFESIAAHPHMLWHDKQQNWLAGAVTFGSNSDFKKVLRQRLLDTPIDQWIYGHDQMVLRQLAPEFDIRPISNIGEWVAIGKGTGVFLTLKGRQKNKDNMLQIYDSQVKQATVLARRREATVRPELRAVALVGPWWQGLPLPEFTNIQEANLEDIRDQPLPDLWIIHNNTDNKRTKRYRDCYNYITQSRRPWIVVESPTFRFNQARPESDQVYYRWSWFSYFYHDGIHFRQDSPADRWHRIQKEQNIEIHPWQPRGDDVLFMMQRPRDSSMVPLINKWGSYENMVLTALKMIRHRTNRPIRIRLHPSRLPQQLPIIESAIQTIKDVRVSDHSCAIDDNWVSGGDSLYRDFDTAWAVVGGNSNSLTESACYGLPTYCLHQSAMAWPVSQNNILDIERPNLNIPRDQWLANLGYSQWRRDEIEAGLPWEHLMHWWPRVLRDSRLQEQEQ